MEKSIPHWLTIAVFSALSCNAFPDSLLGAIDGGGASPTDVLPESNEAGNDGGGNVDGGTGVDGASTVDAGSDATAPPVSRYAAAVKADAPRVYLRLGESAGQSVAQDVAGSPAGKLDGAYSLNVARGVNGPLVGDTDTAIRFDGSSSIALPAGLDFSGRKPFAIELWVNVAAGNSTFGAVVDGEIYDPPRRGWTLRIGDSLNFERWVDASNVDVASATAPAAGAWHHIVATYDGSTQYLFVDGASVQQVGSTRSLPAQATGVSIGKQNCSTCGSDTAFQGSIDELAIYDHALNLQRAQAHYAAAR